MAKINFTKEDEAKMYSLAVQFLFANTAWKTTVGTVTDLIELIHSTHINTLKEHYKMYKSQLEKLDVERLVKNAVESAYIQEVNVF